MTEPRRVRLPQWGRIPVFRRLFPDVGAWYADLAVGLGILALLWVGVQVATGGPGTGPGQAPQIRLTPRVLPAYAALSFFRMAAAYALSLAFALAYGYVAAYHRRAERILIPVLDILQSIPILSFLPTFVLALVALFPRGRTGVELASILLIFTSQAWNMTFAVYHALVTIPAELREVAAMYQLSPWQRFRQLELPFATVGLVWNSMMSWSGGWFFLMASEMFTLQNRDFRLPGIGSYLQAAANAGDVRAIAWGVATMFAVILLMDQLVWRPVIAWADRFKFEMVEGAGRPRSAVLMLLRRSRLVDWVTARVFAPAVERLDRAFARPPAGRRPGPEPGPGGWRRAVVPAATALAAALGAWAAWRGAQLLARLPAAEALRLPGAAAATFLRVTVTLAVAAAWTVPAGVAIGLNRPLAAKLQPVVQMLASFPATALFPVIVLVLLRLPGGLDVAAGVLMLLGTQWYVLFNVIAGAMSLPEDLKEASDIFALRGWERWRTLILPGIFPFLVTGLITAAGGAWNATIVAEYVKFQGQTYATRGLGSLIATATDRGDYALLLAATVTLAGLVVLVNRGFWRRLYALAEDRYSLG